ncbi:hypothetical protein TURU_002291 [Turdus rufiventris]|nr:hypothetical protein TURU_002291 [Turdus rufiventris]
MIFVVMLSFYYFSRHVEKLARTLFLWKVDVHEQKERVSEMRRWNEALVANMLPEHVARHFLGSKKRDEVRTPTFPAHIPTFPGCIPAFLGCIPTFLGCIPKLYYRFSGRYSRFSGP